MTDNENKYWAFLSYSPQDNREPRPETPTVRCVCWGDWLHDALKNFSIPEEFIGQVNGRGEIIPERIGPLFPHASEPGEGATLNAEIRLALEQSICLIIICSPRSAQSVQVNETVRYFKQLGRGNNILPIVIAGEPYASETDKPGVSAEAECFVPALRHPVLPDGTLDTSRRAGKSIFVDARHGAEKREILANDHRIAEADLEMAKIQLIALLIGVGFNGLWWREQKRHFFDRAEARQQAREALNQVAEVQRQLQDAHRQTREAQQLALTSQNLPREVQGQIQEAQNQAGEAQNQARVAQQQLQEFQNKVRDTQNQLEESRQRALAAESKVLEAQQQAREVQDQLEATRRQAREAQHKILELQNLPPAMPSPTQPSQDAQNEILKAQSEAQNAQSQLAEMRQQAQDTQDKFLEAQQQLQEFQRQAQAAQTELEVARQQVRAAETKVSAAQIQAREAQDKFQEIQNQTRDVQSQIRAAQDQVAKTEQQRRAARRLNQVFAVLAVLTLLAAGLAVRNVLQQRQIASQALAKATAEATGKFELTTNALEQIQQTLQNIGGAEQAANRRHSLDELVVSLPPTEIPAALTAASVLMSDEQRSYFQKSLLVRLGLTNPLSAMTNASAIVGKIVDDSGATVSIGYFQLAVLENWLKTDLPGAFTWVCELSDADLRFRALDEVIPGVQSQPESESKNKMLETCVRELAKTDVPKALALALTLPEGAWRSGVIAAIPGLTDPFAALREINGLDLLPEIIAPWKQLLSIPAVSPGASPVETNGVANGTNAPIEIKATQ